MPGNLKYPRRAAAAPIAALAAALIAAAPAAATQPVDVRIQLNEDRCTGAVVTVTQPAPRDPTLRVEGWRDGDGWGGGAPEQPLFQPIDQQFGAPSVTVPVAFTNLPRDGQLHQIFIRAVVTGGAYGYAEQTAKILCQAPPPPPPPPPPAQQQSQTQSQSQQQSQTQVQVSKRGPRVCVPSRRHRVRIIGPRRTRPYGKHTWRVHGRVRDVRWSVFHGPRHHGRAWTINVVRLRERGQALPSRVRVHVRYRAWNGCKWRRVHRVLIVRNRDPSTPHARLASAAKWH